MSSSLDVTPSSRFACKNETAKSRLSVWEKFIQTHLYSTGLISVALRAEQLDLSPFQRRNQDLQWSCVTDSWNDASENQKRHPIYRKCYFFCIRRYPTKAITPNTSMIPTTPAIQAVVTVASSISMLPFVRRIFRSHRSMQTSFPATTYSKPCPQRARQ